MKPESTSVQIIRNSLLEYYPGGFYYKIPDIGVPTKKGRFMLKRPFDLLYFWNGNFLAIEVKTIKNKNKFYLNSVKEHQLKALQKIYENQGNSYIVLHIWNKKNSKIYFINTIDYEFFIEYLETSIDVKEIDNLHVAEFSAIVKNGRINLEKSYLFG